MGSIPSSSIGSATASPWPAPRMIGATLTCWATASNDEPVIVKLREWSRMADDLQQERARLASRMREQLWRYYPQMLELADDFAADWFLDLWNQAPTRAKAGPDAG